MFKLLTVIVLLTGMTGGSVRAEEPALDNSALENPAPDDSTRVTIQLQETFSNGLRAVVQSVPWERLVRVEMVYNAGAATDPDSLAGLAHLAEHLLMESGKQHPAGELIRLQTLYSTYRNAFTGTAAMTFVSQCLPDFLPEILNLEADRMRGAVTDSLCFEREKLVVLEELAFRYRLSPHQEFLQSIFQASYPGHHFGRDVGGSPESVRRADSDDYHSFQADRIRPERAVLVISGPVNLESTMEMVRQKFGFGPDAEPYLPEDPEYPLVKAGQIVRDSQDFTGFSVGIACRIPLQDSQESAIAYSLVEFLEESKFGLRLWSVPGEVVLMVYARWNYFRAPIDPEQHYGRLFPAFNPDQDVQRSLGYIWSRLGETLSDLGNQEAFDEARQRVLDSLGRQDEASITGSGVGEVLINGNRYIDPTTMAEILEEITPADLQVFANRYLIPDRAVVGVFHGRDSGRPARIDMAGRVAPGSAMNAGDSMDLLGQDLIEPVIEAYRQADLFQFETIKLSNGIPVHCLVIPDADQWYLGGRRTFAGLKDLCPGKKAGLDYLYNRVVDFDSSQRRSRTKYVPPRELPFHLSIHLQPCRFTYQASGPPESAEKVTECLSHRLKNREFNKGRWSAVLSWGQGNLEDIREGKSNAARAWRWRQLLGDDHPAISRWAPDPDMISGIKYNDLKKIHGKVAGKVGNTVLVATGPLGSLAVGEILKDSFGSKGKRKVEKRPSGRGKAGAGVKGKIFPDLDKADVRLGLSFRLGTLAEPDDSLGTAVKLLEVALKQTLTSRLREQEGLTYNVHSRAQPLGGPILWEVEVTCQPGQAHLALESLRDELSRLGKEGFTPDEWARARLQLTSQALVAFAEADTGLDWMLRLADFGDIPNDPMARIFDIERSRVNAMAVDMLDMGDLVYTVTGPMFEEDIDQF